MKVGYDGNYKFSPEQLQADLDLHQTTVSSGTFRKSASSCQEVVNDRSRETDKEAILDD